MVFSRKQDPQTTPTTKGLPDQRAHNRSVRAHAQHAAATATESVIGNDLSIEGQTITIRCKGSLRVNGDIQADLHSSELEVGREGRITGSIAANTVNVFGHVSGAIQGSQVILHASAEVDGDIHSETLAIETGASFDGRSRKARDGDDITPQLEKPGNDAATRGVHTPPPNEHTTHASPSNAGPFGIQHGAQPTHSPS